MNLASPYIWAKPGWPVFTLRQDALTGPLGRARLAQGTVQGLAHALGLERHPEILQDIWVGEAMATARIEGERLDLEAVRSSVLRKMGFGKPGASPHNVDGLVDVMDDAARNFGGRLTHARLCNWQAALFPSGRSGLARIEVGKYRTHADPMQIVSGRPGKQKVHYTAPPSARVHAEMTRLLAWFRDSAPGGKISIDGLARAAIAHLWFESIHPFEDGNGRIGRALCDMALAQDANASSRIVSLSRQLHENRSQYYAELNAAERGGLDVTDWAVWFAGQFEQACKKIRIHHPRCGGQGVFLAGRAADERTPEEGSSETARRRGGRIRGRNERREIRQHYRCVESDCDAGSFRFGRKRRSGNYRSGARDALLA